MDHGPNLRALLKGRHAELTRLLNHLQNQAAQVQEEINSIEIAGAAINLSFDKASKENEEVNSILDIWAKTETPRGQASASMTMKEAAIKILESENAGLTANEIRERMLDRYGLNYLRSSLCPQLSRLKEEGVLGRRSGRWVLAKHLSHPDETDMLVRADVERAPQD